MRSINEAMIAILEAVLPGAGFWFMETLYHYNMESRKLDRETGKMTITRWFTSARVFENNSHISLVMRNWGYRPEEKVFFLEKSTKVAYIFNKETKRLYFREIYMSEGARRKLLIGVAFTTCRRGDLDMVRSQVNKYMDMGEHEQTVLEEFMEKISNAISIPYYAGYSSMPQILLSARTGRECIEWDVDEAKEMHQAGVPLRTIYRRIRKMIDKRKEEGFTFE